MIIKRIQPSHPRRIRKPGRQLRKYTTNNKAREQARRIKQRG